MENGLMNPAHESATGMAVGASANPGYALGQLAAALRTSQTHDDPATRHRAEQKVATWVRVFEGMLANTLQVGSRTPVAGTPVWATLEIAHGGFATGNLLAGGPLLPHERELFARLPAVSEGAERAALNSYFLTNAGLAELREWLGSGCYRITVPEEGALLVVAWLLDHDNADAARNILDAIAPFFSRLRFYPVPHATPVSTSAVVHLQSVGQTIEALKTLRVSTAIQKQRESLQVWTPLYDRVVELFTETVEGPLPSLRVADNAERPVVEGGWPCQHYPKGWTDRASSLLEDYRSQRTEHKFCKKPEHKKRNLNRLLHYLDVCVKNPRQLTGRDVGMIRAILAGIDTNRGLPGSPRHRNRRAFQLRLLAAPTRTTIAKLLVERLAQHPKEAGLDSLDPITVPIDMAEAARHETTAGFVMPEWVTQKLRRCLAAPVDVLVESGIIPSGEVLARVIPQITAQVRAAGLVDPKLRHLYGEIYAAFRRRRSLLLLNLASQVRLEELPWVQAIDSYRRNGLEGREQARQTLKQVVTLAITAFPQQILPNKLLQEIRTLADTAALKVPIVDEVAADIFMGQFSEKFLRAAQKAGELLRGSLYERYYGISYSEVQRINDVKASRYGTATSPGFVALCTRMADSSGSGGGYVARNGKIIEQEQILTTHNLAVLFDALGLTDAIRPRLRELADHCFEWMCRRLQQKTTPWKARLRTVKNAAYSWRQMIFFLSLLPAESVAEFLCWADEYLDRQLPAFERAFRPAVEGLRSAVNGQPVERLRGTAVHSRRFLGWCTEKHWLLD
jgi:hypothetical protein